MRFDPRLRLILPLVLLALACRTLLPGAALPTGAPPAAVAPTRSPAPPLPTSTLPAPTATLTPAPARYGLRPEDVTFHPGPELYSGDIVSLEIDAAHLDPEWGDVRVSVYAGPDRAQPLASETFGSFGIGGRAQATFWWVWDTAGLEGEQSVTLTVEPAEGGDPLDTLTLTVRLAPAAQRPMPEPLARWAQAESACCVFHYLTGTAAARDIDLIQAEADAALAQVEDALGVRRRDKIPFTLLSRLLGHGGFASSEISLTYLDRNPAGLDLPTVFRHEGVHILDRQIAETRPAFLTEGLAVFVAGGHYKPEDLDRRAAALLALDRFIPLRTLARDFYRAQHEIGYLEAGALVKYLVDVYGWGTFRAMYASLQPAPDELQMLEAGLAAHYGKPLLEIEAEWLAHLRAQAQDPAEIENLRLTIDLFDTLRRYQQQFDPPAYFLSAWLPDGPRARQRGIVADFIRSPRAAENLALEAMLTGAEQALHRGETAEAGRLLQAAQAVLDAGGLFFDPLAARYRRIAQDLLAQGYELQTLDLSGPTPRVTAIRDWPTLETLTYNSD